MSRYSFCIADSCRPNVLLSPQVTTGALIHVYARGLPTRPVHLVERHGVRASAKVRHFVDFMVVRLGV